MKKSMYCYRFLFAIVSGLLLQIPTYAKEDASGCAAVSGAPPSPNVTSDYSPGFYTRLVFDKGTENEVIFHSHELVWLAKKIMKECKEIEPRTPKMKDYESLAEDIFQTKILEVIVKGLGTDLKIDKDKLRLFLIELLKNPEEVLDAHSIWHGYSQGLITWCKKVGINKGFLGSYLYPDPPPEYGGRDEHIDEHCNKIYAVKFMHPFCTKISEPHPMSWLGKARRYREYSQNNIGEWMNVGKRLIYMRTPNESKKKFYVSDHGAISDIGQEHVFNPDKYCLQLGNCRDLFQCIDKIKKTFINLDGEFDKNSYEVYKNLFCLSLLQLEKTMVLKDNVAVSTDIGCDFGYDISKNIIHNDMAHFLFYVLCLEDSDIVDLEINEDMNDALKIKASYMDIELQLHSKEDELNKQYEKSLETYCRGKPFDRAVKNNLFISHRNGENKTEDDVKKALIDAKKAEYNAKKKKLLLDYKHKLMKKLNDPLKENVKEAFQSYSPLKLIACRELFDSCYMNLDFDYEFYRYRNEFLLYDITNLNGNKTYYRNITDAFEYLSKILHSLDVDGLKRLLKVKQDMTDISKGGFDKLFRPSSTFGKIDGETYRAFGEAFDDYYLECKYNFKTPFTDRELAVIFRRVLHGEGVPSEKLNFIPNLAAAWFVSEVSRNESSLLTGLMLLDLIESGKECLDNEGKNWYEWRHLCVHSCEDGDGCMKADCRFDLYNNRIQRYKFAEDVNSHNAVLLPVVMDDFSVRDESLKRQKTTIFGMHPMSDKGAVNASILPLHDNEYKGTGLSWCRQKEGHIFIHWIYEKIREFFPEIKVELVKYKRDNEDTYLECNPNYTNIIQYFNATGEVVGHNPKLAKFLKLKCLIRSLIETRLSSLDLMLGVDKIPGALNTRCTAQIKHYDGPDFPVRRLLIPQDPAILSDDAKLNTWNKWLKREEQKRELYEKNFKEKNISGTKVIGFEYDSFSKELENELDGYKILLKDRNGFYHAVWDQLGRKQINPPFEKLGHQYPPELIKLFIEGSSDITWTPKELINQFVRLLPDVALGVLPPDSADVMTGGEYRIYYLNQQNQIVSVFPNVPDLPDKPILRIVLKDNCFYSLQEDSGDEFNECTPSELNTTEAICKPLYELVNPVGYGGSFFRAIAEEMERVVYKPANISEKVDLHFGLYGLIYSDPRWLFKTDIGVFYSLFIELYPDLVLCVRNDYLNEKIIKCFCWDKNKKRVLEYKDTVEMSDMEHFIDKKQLNIIWKEGQFTAISSLEDRAS